MEASAAIVAKCLAELPSELLPAISAAYRRRVAPRPKFTGYAELRTMAPKVVSKSWYGVNGKDLWTEVNHEFPYVVGFRTFVISMTLDRDTGRPAVFYVDETLAGGFNLTRNRANVYVHPNDGGRGTLRLSMFVNGGDRAALLPPRVLESRETVKEIVGALCIVCKRYNYDLLGCRLVWDHATRKQKCVRHLWVDA